MPDSRPAAPKVEIPPDVSEADALDQARSVAEDEEEEVLPSDIAADEPEADALDQSRRAELDEEPG